MPEVSSCVVEAMIRGYHEYKSIWEAEMGEILACIREPSNVHDPYAVVVVRSSIIVGHVPRKLSSICSIFIQKGGTISCQVSGGRRYSADLIATRWFGNSLCVEISMGGCHLITKCPTLYPASK